MEKNLENFIKKNSPDGGFLQSVAWRNFQKSVGRQIFCIEQEYFYASIIEHALPIVGKYFYVPRGPVFQSRNSESKNGVQELINLAKKNKIGWIRIEPATDESLCEIGENIEHRITKAPHDVQPREIFVIDISKTEEDLLVQMKSKTRYNIRLAEKKGVKVSCIAHNASSRKYLDEFIRLVRITAKRDGIVSHPEKYYRKMSEVVPGEILKLYIAEYEGKVVAANLVLFYGDTCTYMHGASDNVHRSVMAPYLLQWKQIQDAKKVGCLKYDFGGISVENAAWAGITRFKSGFSPATQSSVFPGSHDIVIDEKKYLVYKLMSFSAKLKKYIK